MLDLGSVAHFVVNPRDANGALADVTTMTATVTLPDGTTATPSPSHGGTGIYTVDYTTSQAGRHRLDLVGTGGAGGPFTYGEAFNVWPADPRFLFSLTDAKKEINKDSTIIADDEEIRLFMAAVTPVIEDICGPLVTGTVTRTFSGGRGTIILEANAVSITSVTEAGTPITDYTYDSYTGVLYAGASGSPRTFAYGSQNISIQYQAASGVVPTNVILAALEELRFLWQVGQQGTRPTFGGAGDEDVAFTPSGYAVPRRVIELCAGSRRGPGVG